MYVTANGNPCEAPAASPVIQSHYPQWFIERMHGVSDPSFESLDELNLLRRLAKSVCNCTTWIDHEGTTIVADKELFVSEPYLRPIDDLSCAEEIARLLDCDLFVATSSYWFPGKTIRLKFRPKGSDWDVDACHSDEELSLGTKLPLPETSIQGQRSSESDLGDTRGSISSSVSGMSSA